MLTTAMLSSGSSVCGRSGHGLWRGPPPPGCAPRPYALRRLALARLLGSRPAGALALVWFAVMRGRRRRTPAGRRAWSGWSGAGVLTAECPPWRRGRAAGPRRASSTVWLCRPGQAADPCTSSRAATSVTGSGATSPAPVTGVVRGAPLRLLLRLPDGLDRARRQRRPAVKPAERAAAVVQASRFSQRCTVWAPMYRQVTVAGLAHGDEVGAGHRVRQPAVGLEGLSRPRQPRPADHLHRAFAGLGHAHQAAADPGRSFAEPAKTDGVRHPPGGQRAGPHRPGRRRHVPHTSPPAARRRRPAASSPIRPSAHRRRRTRSSGVPGGG